MGAMIAASVFRAGSSELLGAIGNVSHTGKRMNSLHQLNFSRHARPLTLLEGFAYQLFAIVFRFICQVFANNLSNSYQVLSRFF
jgi:hypothetical protein